MKSLHSCIHNPCYFLPPGRGMWRAGSCNSSRRPACHTRSNFPTPRYGNFHPIRRPTDGNCLNTGNSRGGARRSGAHYSRSHL